RARRGARLSRLAGRGRGRDRERRGQPGDEPDCEDRLELHRLPPEWGARYLMPRSGLPCGVLLVVPQRPLGERPPARLALRQLALELADVQRQLGLLAVEPLLELGQLDAPALD